MESKDSRNDMPDVGLNTYSLLMELMGSEPTILACLRVVQSSCLAQGFECKIKGSRVSPLFHDFLQQQYLPFCENAIRAMFTCGFVPWRLRKIHTGDAVPEVLPLGTFEWTIEANSNQQHKHTQPGKNFAAGCTQMMIY